ncbi:7-deoxyloganetic acid glucosyltransferase-like [Olea europaea var. sylvestris]|uniref:7-deoxyloganetic acid glucosyltransferase-like n=1 Tax=Olea europaea var. sylvestris TaxID=158386 RepID=UPI000C1CE94D|nr:7-deoxyloganetic acid glucosyltransferase-like [Olea europaea var. sylvestris]
MERECFPPPPHPHVIVFPFPVHSHVHVMLNLAEILSLHGFHITFFITEYTRKSCYFREISSHFARYLGFHFQTISDGLPFNHPRTGDKVAELFNSIDSTTKPQFKEVLKSGLVTRDGRPPITCVIADGIMCFTIDIAKEFQLPTILFRPFSASCFWSLFCVPKLIDALELPLKGDYNMDKLVSNVPGMEGFLRLRDLPSFCRANDLSDPKLQHVVSETHRAASGYGLILNTFEELEEFSLAHIRTKFQNVYTIGPLHASLKTKTTLQMRSSSGLKEEESKCMAWLDDQALKSVVYVSFGNMTVLDIHQLMEFWHGLVNSGKPFLLVIPANLISEEFQVPRVHFEGTKQRGKAVNWAPQEEALAHPAIGGFLTHSGWNSTLESICEGVPMICWPFYADQQVNSRLVGEVWKIGLDMKDICDRVIVEKMVKELLDVRREDFMKSANQMARLARKSVSQGGTSYCNLNRLIEDIKSMNCLIQDIPKSNY